MENISLVKMEMTTFKSIASFSGIFLLVYIIKTKISPSFPDQGKYLVLQAGRLEAEKILFLGQTPKLFRVC